MTKNIIDKINQVVKNKIETESQVVYIFIQCIKCLDDEDDSYPIIRLFRNWVAHNKLSHSSTRHKQSSAEYRLDSFYKFFLKQKHGGMFEFMDEGFTLFKDLKDELLTFFKENEIDTDFIQNRDEWGHFVQILYEILKDVPLESNGEIKTFSFSDNVIKHDGYFAISFKISFANGVTKDFTMHIHTILGCR